MSTTETAPLRNAATVLIYRCTPEPQIFMVERHGRSPFMAHAMVFPGGRVDPEDDSDGWDAHCNDTWVSSSSDEPNAQALRGHRIAAIRESFEEAGVLFATYEDQAIDPTSDLGRRLFGEERVRLNAGETTFLECVKRYGLSINTRVLVPLTRWITPKIEKRRFDARFYSAHLPENQVPLHDAHETTSGQWLSPQNALDLYARKEIVLAPPTLRILLELNQDWSAIERPSEGLRTPVAPQAFTEEDTLHLLLPGDTHYDPSGQQTNRISNIGGQWVSIGRGF